MPIVNGGCSISLKPLSSFNAWQRWTNSTSKTRHSLYRGVMANFENVRGKMSIQKY